MWHGHLADAGDQHLAHAAIQLPPLSTPPPLSPPLPPNLHTHLPTPTRAPPTMQQSTPSTRWPMWMRWGRCWQQQRPPSCTCWRGPTQTGGWVGVGRGGGVVDVSNTQRRDNKIAAAQKQMFEYIVLICDGLAISCPPCGGECETAHQVQPASQLGSRQCLRLHNAAHPLRASPAAVVAAAAAAAAAAIHPSSPSPLHPSQPPTHHTVGWTSPRRPCQRALPPPCPPTPPRCCTVCWWRRACTRRPQRSPSCAT
jgi:hypothetical protein